MELWFSEKHTPNVKLSIRVDKQLYSAQSDYQRIDIYDSQLLLKGLKIIHDKNI